MPLPASALGVESRLGALLDYFAVIDDLREPWKVAHPLPEVSLLAVCGTIADCDDYDHIAAWGEAHLPFLREILPFHHGVPGGRWLTLLMNRIDPGLFSACFTAWVRETWPDRPDFVATDVDKRHSRIEERTVTVSREADWLGGGRRFPGELRLPGATAIIKVRSRTELKDRCRTDIRYYISSASLIAETAAHAVRGHWGTENRLHWVLDVVFAINLVRTVTDKKSLKLRRKAAGWDVNCLASILGIPAR